MKVVTTGNLKKNPPSQGNGIFILINLLQQMEKYHTKMNI